MLSRHEELCTNQYIIVSLLVSSTTLQIDLPFILTLIKKQHLNEISHLPNTVAYVTFSRNKLGIDQLLITRQVYYSV